MNTLTAAVASEFRKISSTRLWWILALALFLYVAAMAGGLGALLGATDAGLIGEDVANTGGMPLDPTLIYTFASSIGFVFPVIFGAIMVTQEFRHKTVNPTFLATPKRGVSLTAKVITMFVWGGILGLIGTIGSVGVGAAVLGGFGADTLLGDSETWAIIGRMILALALWGAIGTGLGALIPSQIASIAVVIAFTQFVEPLLRFAATLADWTAEVGNFLPGAASDALVGASFYSVIAPGTGLEWWQGALVLAAIAAATTIGGYFVSWRRDIT
ncbi:ABC transporter permease [Lysinibacter cavernae]|uniref:ABC-type transport system involved in multi-copper enzyme maturation permease subunit n=1 Tax=Lysinibacter cavernae TaxID=1640652 RepID=A0A7X5R3E5_9MICO|nr:ABC transporter permease [Lysinibacter cavernae]NIH54904.1 ABC-type transport system involved in multi-copper enzyme maturation permease subunit [Lysinibacter cavernae]